MIDVTHIHPMLVHFPIVLFILAVLLQIAVVARGGDLTERDCLPRTALAALLLGTVAAVAAVIFGDIAMDHAHDLGFPRDPLEEHEELGFATMWIFVALSVVQLGALWRGIPLEGGKGWILVAAGVVGVGVLAVAGYHGGELVYELGVNVTPVKP